MEKRKRNLGPRREKAGDSSQQTAAGISRGHTWLAFFATRIRREKLQGENIDAGGGFWKERDISRPRERWRKADYYVIRKSEDADKKKLVTSTWKPQMHTDCAYRRQSVSSLPISFPCLLRAGCSRAEERERERDERARQHSHRGEMDFFGLFSSTCGKNAR